ncbi:MAG: hypothetical protein J2P23_02555, partial [Microlunatus sp.]|nr:hypothetical protein [Microlunatus sp.]
MSVVIARIPWPRRSAVPVLILLLGLMLVAGPVGRPAAAAPAGAGDRTLWAGRAEASYLALQRYLYQGEAGHRLYAESLPAGANPYSYLWE